MPPATRECIWRVRVRLCARERVRVHARVFCCVHVCGTHVMMHTREATHMNVMYMEIFLNEYMRYCTPERSYTL